MSRAITSHKGLFVSLLLATILAVGAWVTWVIAVGVGTTVVSQFAVSRRSTRLSFTLDGEGVLQSFPNRNYAKVVSRTLDGRTINDSESLHLQEETYRNTDMPGPRERTHDLLPPHMRIRGWLVPPASTFWYLVWDSPSVELAYFAGYSAETRRIVGFIGSSGFQVDRPAAEDRFVVKNFYHGAGAFAPTYTASWGQQPNVRARDSDETVFIISDESLYRVDLERHSVRAIPDTAGIISLGSVSEPTRVADERQAIYKHRFVLRFADRLRILDNDGATLHELAIPRQIQPYNFTLFDTTGDDWIAVRNLNGGWFLPTKIVWFNTRGELSRQEQVRLSSVPEKDLRTTAWFGAALLPLPAVYAAASLVGPVLSDGSADALAGLADEVPVDDAGVKFAEALSAAWLPLLIVCAASAIAAAVCYRHHRRYAGQGAMTWATFVFLLGLPGLAGYWLHRPWPARERCASCGRSVPRDRQRCLACEVEFPLPAPRGIEILA